MSRAGRKHETGEGVSQRTFGFFAMRIAIYQCSCLDVAAESEAKNLT